MLKSDSIIELAKALSKAQGEMGGAKKSSENPFFKSKYADLGEVFNAIRDPLSKNGLAVSQLIQPDPEMAVVETLLMHESGEWLSSIIQLRPVKTDPQGMGSAITYARRYGLGPIVGVATEEDDDGNAASNPGAKSSKAEPRGTFAPPVKKDAEKPPDTPAPEATVESTVIIGDVPAMDRKDLIALITDTEKKLTWTKKQLGAACKKHNPEATKLGNLTHQQLVELAVQMCELVYK